MVFRGRVNAAFVKGRHAGPGKGSATLCASVPGLRCLESAGGTQKLFVRNLKELSSHREKKGGRS